MGYTVLSLGGSIIIPKTGFNPTFLRQLQTMIRRQVANGHRFIIVVGGGTTARNYQQALKDASKPSEAELDWMGIAATKINATFVHFLFKDIAYKDILSDPRQTVRTKKPVIIANGWKPGRSTDYGAVMLAKHNKAKRVFNLSNIEYVYTKDPNKYKDATPIEHVTWKDYRTNIIDSEWHPGANAPFDPVASKIADKEGMTVMILNGTDLKNVAKAIQGKKAKGTMITP